MSNKRYKSGNQKLQFEGRPMSWPHLYLLLDIILTFLHILASDYLIYNFYWTLHWLSFTFKLLITSFVSFIGQFIDCPSHSSWWLPYLYLLLDITLASFKFQLLITSFVSFIGHDIGRPSNCSFWLPHLM
jgi:hypothetical protein